MAEKAVAVIIRHTSMSGMEKMGGREQTINYERIGWSGGYEYDGCMRARALERRTPPAPRSQPRDGASE